MRKLSTLIIVLLMLLSMAACGNAPDATPTPSANDALSTETPGAAHDPVTLRISVRYSDDDTIKPYDYAVACLAKDMPWITLELDPMPADDGVKLKSQIATGDLPDIFAMSGGELLDSAITAGAIVDMTDKITENGFLAKVLPAAYSKLYHTDDKIYTMPYTGTEVVLMFVNKDIFEQYDVAIPTTIDELVNAAETFSANDVATLPIFGKEAWICNAMYDCLVTRYIPAGLSGLSEGHSVREDGYLKAAKDLERLSAAGAFPTGVTTLNYEQSTNLWYNGESAMFLNGQWEIDTTVSHLGDSADWIPIPAATTDDIETSQYAFTGGKGTAAGLSVSAWSQNFDLAVDVACYLSEKYAEYNYTQRGSSTIAITCDKPMEVQPAAMSVKLSETIPLITSTTVFAGMGGNMELFTVLGEGTQSLLAGVITAEEFIESVAAVTGD